MKILNVNKFYRLVGGSDRYYFDLSQLLESQGHQVIPFSMHDNRNRSTPYEDYFVSTLDYSQISLSQLIRNGPRIIGKTVYSFESKRKIESLIQVTMPDIAHIHMIDHQISPSIINGLKKYGIPMIQTLHEYKLICPNYRLYIQKRLELCERCKGGKYYNTVVHRCLRNSTLGSFLACVAMYIHKQLKIYERNINTFIVPSRFAKEKMIEFGIDADKLVFLPNMVDTKKFRPNYGHSNYILYYGRLAREKGIHTLIDAFRKIPKSQLYIVGTGELEEELKRLVEEEGMDNVKMLGYKTGEALQSLIREAQFVVIPSEWYEMFGLTIVESFACGKPVIGTNIGGIPELINEETGLLFQPGNVEELAEKIVYFLSHPSVVEDFGRNARKFVEDNFSPPIHLEKIMSLYNKFLNKI